MVIDQIFEERDNMACPHKAIESIVESNDPFNKSEIFCFVEAFKAKMYMRGIVTQVKKTLELHKSGVSEHLSLNICTVTCFQRIWT